MKASRTVGSNAHYANYSQAKQYMRSQARYGGTSKLICQHTASFEIKVGANNVLIAPRSWFVNDIIMADGNNWTARQFNPKHKHTLGVPIKTSKQQPTTATVYKPNTIPVNIWREGSRASHRSTKSGRSNGSSRNRRSNGSSRNRRSFARRRQFCINPIATNGGARDNHKLVGENTILNENMDKLASDNKVQTAQITAQACRISKHDKYMQEMRNAQLKNQYTVVPDVPSNQPLFSYCRDKPT
jgi:hypothetical protein